MLQTTHGISEQIIATLPSPTKGNRLHYFSGASLQGKRAPSGFAVRITASGRKTFVRFYRVGGKPFLATLGHWTGNAKGGDLSVLRAIIAATEHARSIRDGDDPRPQRTQRLEDGNKPEGETISDLLDTLMKL